MFKKTPTPPSKEFIFDAFLDIELFFYSEFNTCGIKNPFERRYFLKMGLNQLLTIYI